MKDKSIENKLLLSLVLLKTFTYKLKIFLEDNKEKLLDEEEQDSFLKILMV